VHVHSKPSPGSVSVCQNGLPEDIRHSPSAPFERLRARKDKTKTVHVTPGSWQITARSKLAEDRADAPTS